MAGHTPVQTLLGQPLLSVSRQRGIQHHPLRTEEGVQLL